jgi:hypothetical protein
MVFPQNGLHFFDDAISLDDWRFLFVHVLIERILGYLRPVSILMLGHALMEALVEIYRNPHISAS